MRRIKQAKPSPALLVAVIALVAALGGGAVAGVAVTSLNKKDKKQVKKISKKQAKKLDKRIELKPGPQGETGAKGDAGAPGATGDQGPPGESAADYWATIRVAPDGGDPFDNPDLLVVGSKGTVTGLRYGATGVYLLAFEEVPDANRACAYTATLADVSGNGISELNQIKGEILVTGDYNGHISVHTFDSLGNPRDVGTPAVGYAEGGFHLAVFCP